MNELVSRIIDSILWEDIEEVSLLRLDREFALNLDQTLDRKDEEAYTRVQIAAYILEKYGDYKG